jgi:ergothioneine biosynthesis protein EgtB
LGSQYCLVYGGSDFVGQRQSAPIRQFFIDTFCAAIQFPLCGYGVLFYLSTNHFIKITMKTIEELKSRFLVTRDLTENICNPLELEDYVPQPIVEVSPPKWHLAHSTWFFEQFILIPHDPDYQIFSPDFAFLFNSYYNNAGKRILRPNRGLMSRPPVKEVMAYRKYVTAAILSLMEGQDFKKELKELITLGINHEQQHQELLVYDIKYILGNQPTFPVYGDFYGLEKEEGEAGFENFPEGVYEVGANGKDFCFDNECGHHKVYLNDFEISNKLVTNGEFIGFIDAGGYSDFNLWLSEGWDFIKNEKIESPMYWHKQGEDWYNYTLNGFEKVNLDLPLQHISFYEALAFASWKGMRLPSEFEWEIASEKFSWGKLWEWTYSAYHPYPGFEKVPGALGEYNGKFMVNQYVLRGASVATPKGHSRKTYRNFFPSSARWLFSGIRLVK